MASPSSENVMSSESAPSTSGLSTGGENEIAAVSAPAPKSNSVVVMFKATGGAPILKQSKFKIQGSEKFSKVVEFVCKLLHRDSVFVYLNSAFTPSMDELVSTLFEGFGIDGKLVVNYSVTPAWG
mmetsp:Transcript_42453/g.81133  ORF Transcript_42453/g.81133 Transcript_42453/m.81133 type:complete len:125 (-) Transcript_42453:93-467(-)|eukprot:CAMPEP_0114249924 /NCGR_PEP_ID=MMETSP0058-20121206/14420_1 /TAXON_ID=36894 /ORGANISM="Pyramimonas parkeae, CCMP726" /LENGTH=124 /DNA_ID=CAMNT_0001363539 /DNA_START=290 /DNA_END=664 /DNA_ORIENTATION=+